MCIFILLLFLTICMCCVYLDLRIVGLRRVCSTTLRYATYPTRFAIRDSSIAFENFFFSFVLNLIDFLVFLLLYLVTTIYTSASDTLNGSKRIGPRKDKVQMEYIEEEKGCVNKECIKSS